MSKVLPDLTPLRTSRGFRLLFVSRTTTALGSQAAEVAVLVQAKQLTGSPLAVGMLGVAELVPLIAFGLYGGVLADRFDRRALMRWCEVGLACCAGLLLLNALLPRPSVAALFALVAVTMAVSSVQRPSMDASFPRLVPREQLTAAAAVMSFSQNISVVLGASLGGALAVAPGPWLVYALDAAGFAVSFCFLSRLQPLPRLDGAAGVPRPAWREIGAGLRYAVGRRDLLGSYAADLVAMFFGYPNAMFPFMAVTLHAPWSAGLMFSAPAVGAFAAAGLSGWMGRVRRQGLAIAVAAAVFGLAIAGFGLSPELYVALGCLVVAGGADEISAIFRQTLWNQTIPDELRGRLAGVELLSYGIGPSAGQLRSGVTASLTSVRFSLISGGACCVGGVAAVCALLPALVRYALRTLPQRESRPSPSGLLAEAPVQHPGRGVDRGAGIRGGRGIQHRPDQPDPVLGSREQQAVAGRVGVAGLDPGSTRVAPDQRVGLLPHVLMVPVTGRQVVLLLPHDLREQRIPHGRLPQLDQVRRAGVRGVLRRVRHTVDPAEMRMGHAQPRGRGVHLGDERRPPCAVRPGESEGGVTAGLDQHGCQQILGGELVTGDQASAARPVIGGVLDRALSDRDLPIQVTGLQDHQRGHHLGNAAHRPPDVRVGAPQGGAGAGVDQHAALDRDARPRGPGGTVGGRGRPHDRDSAQRTCQDASARDWRSKHVPIQPGGLDLGAVKS
jgi:MFS family permease